MTWGFEVGSVYNRRRDIHDRFGGSRQNGIITFRAHPLIVIVSGESGKAHGYADRWRTDGVFEYFGEGQVGDMRMDRGNKALTTHSADSKTVLLFRDEKLGYRYQGEFVYQGHHIEDALDRNDDMRKAIVFELRPLEAIQEELAQTPAVQTQPLWALHRRALEAAGQVAGFDVRSRTVYERSRDVRDYVLARADGKCEGCGAPAPFRRPDGSPYLEAHHIHRVSDGGPDHPRFVIGLCPTCHRRVHAGADGADYNRQLLAIADRVEPKVWV